MSYSIREASSAYVGSDGRNYFPGMEIPRGVSLRNADSITGTAFRHSVDVSRRKPAGDSFHSRSAETGAEWAQRLAPKRTDRTPQSEAGEMIAKALGRDDVQPDETDSERIARWKKMFGKEV